ncbi:T-cell immunomodulatory protein-like [Tubulanus polymorphus]|uniref:T-cell immunomodulatory protein-like n=1 Tax=Tubulanus polymorphus TaxID=672921 RepID=UPI003DA5AE54
MTRKKLLSLIVCASLVLVVEGGLNDVTSSLLGGIDNGILAAFADFTGDKNADLLVITNNGTSVLLVAGQKEGKYFRQTLIENDDAETKDTRITSVMPSDFDGDGHTDTLITRQSHQNPDAVIVDIYWGTDTGYRVQGRYRLPQMLRDQPSLLDYDGDMVTDIFGEISSGMRRVWRGKKGHRNFTMEKFPGKPMAPFKFPSCNAFIDLNNDLIPDMMVTVEDKATGNEHIRFEYWINKDGNFVKNSTDISLPTNGIKQVGQSAFIDINGDGLIDHLLPVCLDKDCNQSQIYVHSQQASEGEWSWSLMMESIPADEAGQTWGFALPKTKISTEPRIPITLRLGDFNLDGYPDILAVLRTENKGKVQQKAFILNNVACTTRACSKIRRTFQAEWHTPALSNVQNVDVAAFFDIYENGILDIFLHNSGPKGGLHAFYHTFNGDAYFVKVTVVNGLCLDDCPGKEQPQGTNVVGPTINYMIYDSEGNLLKGVEGQLSQSTHFALQMPYTVFGLGQTPNYVESLGVGISSPKKEKRTKTWKSIIPNSQIIIIPYPIDVPGSWVSKLFISPLHDKQVLYTGATLIGTCGFVAGIVGILHWREKREDKIEKLQEAQKFHFDAM